MTTNNSWNNGSAMSAFSANQAAANLFKVSNASTTQTLTTTTGGGTIYYCTNASAISLTLPAASSFSNNFIDFIFAGVSAVTLIAPTGTFNGTGGPTSIVIPPNTQGCRITTNGSSYIVVWGLFNGETLPSALTIPQPLLVGNTVAGTPAAGNIGQQLSSIVLVGSAVSLTSGSSVNITSLSLNGIFWVTGELWLNPGSGTVVSNIATSLGTTSGLLQTTPSANTATTNIFNPSGVLGNNFIPAGSGCFINASVASPQTVFLVADATFTVNTCTGYGKILAYRIG